MARSGLTFRQRLARYRLKDVETRDLFDWIWLVTGWY